MKNIKLFENFINEAKKDPIETLIEKYGLELVDDEELDFIIKEDTLADDKEELKKVKDLHKKGVPLYKHEQYVKDNYEGFDGTDKYFNSDGTSWEALKIVEKSKGAFEIVAEYNSSDMMNYYTLLSLGDQKTKSTKSLGGQFTTNADFKPGEKVIFNVGPKNLRKLFKKTVETTIGPAIIAIVTKSERGLITIKNVYDGKEFEIKDLFDLQGLVKYNKKLIK